MKYKSDKDAQVNKVISHPTSSILVTNENNSLSVFDINQNKQVQVLNQAHSDTLTGLIFNNNPNLFSTVGHDSVLKTWD